MILSNLNCPILIKENESIVKNILTKTISQRQLLHDEFYHPFKEEIKPVCIKHLQRYKRKKYLKGKYYLITFRQK